MYKITEAVYRMTLEGARVRAGRSGVIEQVPPTDCLGSTTGRVECKRLLERIVELCRTAPDPGADFVQEVCELLSAAGFDVLTKEGKSI